MRAGHKVHQRSISSALPLVGNTPVSTNTPTDPVSRFLARAPRPIPAILPFALPKPTMYSTPVACPHACDCPTPHCPQTPALHVSPSLHIYTTWTGTQNSRKIRTQSCNALPHAPRSPYGAVHRNTVPQVPLACPTQSPGPCQTHRPADRKVRPTRCRQPHMAWRSRWQVVAQGAQRRPAADGRR